MYLDSGHSLEFHEVQTQDGYILILQRVIPVKSSKIVNCDNDDGLLLSSTQEVVKKPPVLIVHGFLGSGEHWFMNGRPEKCLPNMVASAGYDCWVANLRGTNLSKGHAYLSTDSADYWDFSWFEMAYYDIPAMITYILNITGSETLSYCGHSMGCTILLVAIILKQKILESKIKVMVSLAPAAYGNNQTNTLIKCTNFIATRLGAYKPLYTNQLMFGSTILGSVRKLCPQLLNPTKIGRWLFKFLFMEYGVQIFSTGQVEETRIPRIIERWPASTSVKLWCHGAQSFKSGYIGQFDYGRKINLKRYGQISPPIMDFRNVKIPIAIFYSDDDQLCPAKDVHKLDKELGNVIRTYKVNSSNFAHGDFLLGKDADKLVYERVIQVIGDSRIGSI